MSKIISIFIASLYCDVTQHHYLIGLFTSGHSFGGFFMSFLKIIINNCILYYKKYYICTSDGNAPFSGKAGRGKYLN